MSRAGTTFSLVTLTFDSLFSGAVGPLLVALVLALTTIVVPSVRWARTLKRETVIFNGLPPGDERELWRERVEAQAARLRYHEQQVALWERIAGWVAIAYTCLVAYVAVAGAFRPPEDAWMWVWASIGFVAFGWAAVRTLVGLPFFTDTTPEFKAARKRVRQLRRAK